MSKKYNIIYADPAWEYNERNNGHTKFGRGVHGYYPVMSYSDIKALRVQDIADDNCALILWVTFPLLDKQIKIIEHWGFRYCTIAFVWIKTNKRQNLEQASFFPCEYLDTFFGVGYYTKSNTEICLLGMKGQVPVKDNTISNIILAPREEHSKKPNIVRDKITDLFGDIPRIELFARDKAYGWDVWGNEVNNDVELVKQHIQ